MTKAEHQAREYANEAAACGEQRELHRDSCFDFGSLRAAAESVLIAVSVVVGTLGVAASALALLLFFVAEELNDRADDISEFRCW